VTTLSSYTIETFVGDGTTGLSGDGGPATTASLNFTQAVCVDSLGNIYAADTNNNRIRKISPSGIISTIAGTGTAGYSGDGGLATNAALINPYSICVDSKKNLYFSDSGNNVIRMISAETNIISTIAGTGTAGYSGDGGAASAAMLSNPLGVFVDNTGYIYVADSGNFRVRRFTLGGTISTIAGDGAAATLSNPTSVYVDNAGRIYISATGNNLIRMFSGGALTTVAGGGTGTTIGDGGLATSASLSGPRGIFGDSAGNIYFADTLNQRIRRFTVGGIINTFVGNGTAEFSGDGGSATAAMLRNPYGVFVSNTGSIYIADTFNNRIRRFDADSVVTRH
jgi:sugar lactone lactonase YvrE